MYFFKTFAILLIIAISSGCTYTTKPSVNTAFYLELPKIQKRILLKIPEETLTKVTEEHYMGSTVRVPVGLILEQNGIVAFRTIFDGVSMDQKNPKSDWLVTITAKPETKINLGMTNFSEQAFTTALQCDIESPEGGVVWSKTIVTEATGRRALEGALSALSPLGAIAIAAKNSECSYSGYICALQDAANESVAKALRQLVDEIYQAKAQIFKLPLAKN